jgi:hypothetical protein
MDNNNKMDNNVPSWDDLFGTTYQRIARPVATSLSLKDYARRKIRNIIELKYEEKEECAICLTSMEDKKVLHIPCGHTFHYNCIFSVFNGMHPAKNKCPLCRYDNSEALEKIGITTAEEETVTEETTNEEIEMVMLIVNLFRRTFQPACFHYMLEHLEPNSLEPNSLDLHQHICQTCAENVGYDIVELLDIIFEYSIIGYDELYPCVFTAGFRVNPNILSHEPLIL